MKVKSALIMISTTLCGLALWSGLLGVRFDKNDRSGSSLILKIEKNSKGGLAVGKYYSQGAQILRNVSEVSFPGAGEFAIVQRCREQPVLYGVLLIFFSSSACIAGFVVHMLRTDPRFQ